MARVNYVMLLAMNKSNTSDYKFHITRTNLNYTGSNALENFRYQLAFDSEKSIET